MAKKLRVSPQMVGRWRARFVTRRVDDARVLAPARLPVAYAAWNRKWQAPYGRIWRKLVPRVTRSLPVAAQLAGMFAFQPNNTTRVFEYPWAFDTLVPEPGKCVLEIGGGLSGFQFVLSLSGCRVTNVDPGIRARGTGWHVDEALLRRLNRRFGTDVTLAPCFIDEAALKNASFDYAVSLSVIEHLREEDIRTILDNVHRVLVPGGRFVLTLDLFLDLAPFEKEVQNRYGKNISARWLVDQSGFELVGGKQLELHGFDEFDPDAILRAKDRYLVGRYYPTMVQLLVLQKAA